jgi:hypothetical protein
MKAPLFNLAHARSGDKGNLLNIGLIARQPAFYAPILREVTATRVRAFFGPLCGDRVHRYELANLSALNFVLHDALDGGGLASLRLDPQGKTYGFALLRMEIEVPDDLAEAIPDLVTPRG